MSTQKPLSLLPIVALALFACGGDDSPATGESPTAAPVAGESRPEDPLPSGHPPMEPAPAAAAATGKVLEKADAGQYTYVKVDAGGNQDWFAAPAFQVAVGDTVELPTGALPMRDFESKALGRTFDVVYFVQALRKVGADDMADAVAEAHAGAPVAPEMREAELEGIERPEGGKTVAEVFAAGAAASGQEVLLRAKVVKFNANILGKNWLHVRDGTGSEGSNDLVVTTMDTVKVGDTVLIRGKLAADRDLGFGYKFDLLIEDAAVVVE